MINNNIIFVILIIIILIMTPSYSEKIQQKNILFIVADDLGFNDVGWNNPNMPTPNLNWLASEGIILNQSYALPICTPSRTAFMTGIYPYKVGLQVNAIESLQPNGIHPKYKLLPQKMKELGYATYMIGKWHLGYCNPKYLPNKRGFDHFYGYYMGHQDYYFHNYTGQYANNTPFTGFDFRDDFKPCRQAIGTYSTKLYLKKYKEYISNRDRTKPFFMYMALQNVHSPLQAPNHRNSKCMAIKDMIRRKYCNMVLQIDILVNEMVKVLERRKLLHNTLIVFTSDNGGQVMYGGNNFPLRGCKGTAWEGGIRVPGFVYAKFMDIQPYVSNKLYHATDWYPTFVSLAQMGVKKKMKNLDGYDILESLKKEEKPSPRNHFIINMLTDNGTFMGIRFKNYKLMFGYPGAHDGWYPPPESKYKNQQFYRQLRDFPQILYYNVKDDPCEKKPLRFGDKRSLVMIDKLFKAMKHYKKPDILDLDPKGDPKFFNNFYSTGWCDIS